MNYYEVLGISPSASNDVIEAVVRVLLKKHHPDGGGEQEHFKHIVSIRDTLLDPSKRLEYDEGLGLRQGHADHTEEHTYDHTREPIGSVEEQTVKRVDGSDTFLSLGEHLQRSGKELSRANLVGRDLSSRNLEGANLQGANLSRANLQQASLEGADLAGANLERAEIEGANFEKCNLRNVNFRGCIGVGPIFMGAQLDSAEFQGAQIPQAKFYYYEAIVQQEFQLSSGESPPPFPDFISPDGRQKNSTILKRVNFEGADLTGSQFGAHKSISDSNRKRVEVFFGLTHYYQYARATAYLGPATLRDCNFSQANLSDSNFMATRVKGCRFAAANLTRSKFYGSDLAGVDLGSANIRNTDFRMASYDKHTKFPAGFDSAPLRRKSPAHRSLLVFAGSLAAGNVVMYLFYQEAMKEPDSSLPYMEFGEYLIRLTTIVGAPTEALPFLIFPLVISLALAIGHYSKQHWLFRETSGGPQR